jgi:hypothetical protein
MNYPRHRKKLAIALSSICLAVYLALVVAYHPLKVIGIDTPLPNLANRVSRTNSLALVPSLNKLSNQNLAEEKDIIIESRRQKQIQKVRRFFKQYGAPLKGYEEIFVDKSEKCGGDYRVLVGIAGSESGLGRHNYKLYNPFGYLDGVQYPNQKKALEILACKVSEQHISKCGTDLYCLGRRYAGPKDDLDHFVSKVRWFMEQVS